MENYLRKEADDACNYFASQIEDAISDCRVNILGSGIMVMFNNSSICNCYPLTKDACDIYCKDCNDKNYDLKDVSIPDALTFLTQIASLTITEESSTGDVAGYDSARAFAPKGQKINRGTEQSQREGWTVAPLNEIDRLKHPFGVDPLGRKGMSEDSVSGQTNQTLSYLAEMLPSDNAEIEGDILTVAIDCVKIIMTQQDDGNYSVQSFVDEEMVQESENLSASDLIKWSFSICGQIQSRCAARDSENNLEISNDEIFSTLKELARDAGMSDDILRNRDLFDLKKLGVTKSQNLIQPNESTPAMETSSSLKGSRMNGQHPVSLNENRDISRPFADTLGGKVLVNVPGVGAMLVSKKDLPRQKYLSWNSQDGIIMVEGLENVQRPSWKFRGYSR